MINTGVSTPHFTLTMIILLVLLAGSIQLTSCLDNGLVRTPWMAWSSWEVFRCTSCEADPERCIGERLVKQTADIMDSEGYRDAGYDILWVDDCWPSRERSNITGRLVPDPSRWPNGMKPVVDYVHSKGLKFGLYGDIGSKTCGNFPGLEGHFEDDARQLAEWGVDAFKVDGCNADPKTMDVSYPAFGEALNKTGRPMIYSCSWPDYERTASIPVNFTKVRNACNSWRIFWDVQAGQYAKTQSHKFDCVSGALEFWATGSTNASASFSADCPGDWKNHPASIDFDAFVHAAGPGGFNDADELPIGVNYTMTPPGVVTPTNALTLVQAGAALTLWVAIASPLMIGADLRVIDPEMKKLWLNKRLIAIHQDSLGQQGVRVRGNASECQVWKRTLSSDSVFVALYNNGQGSCLPPPHPWVGPLNNTYSDSDCPDIGCIQNGSYSDCTSACESNPDCNALNYGSGGCCMRSCENQTSLDNPSGSIPGYSGYRMTELRRNTSTFFIPWSLLDIPQGERFSVSDVLNDIDFGILTGSLTTQVRLHGAAALVLRPVK